MTGSLSDRYRVARIAATPVSQEPATTVPQRTGTRTDGSRAAAPGRVRTSVSGVGIRGSCRDGERPRERVDLDGRPGVAGQSRSGEEDVHGGDGHQPRE